ncbi:MAG: transposase [bacterium]
MINYKIRKIKLKRFYLPGEMYFITCVTENREKIFKEDKNVRILLSVIKYYKEKYEFNIAAYCILPDHFHCLVVPSKKANISMIMKGIKGYSTRLINKTNNANGSLWQHQFLDHIIRADEDYHSHIDYIHENPKKHRIVDETKKYKWSSYHVYYEEEHELNSCLQVDKI